MRYMHKPTTISFNAPGDVKTRLQKMADQYGITVSDLMRMSAMRIIDQGITIEPQLEPTPYLQKLIKEAEADYRAGSTTTITSPAELAEHLDSLRA